MRATCRASKVVSALTNMTVEGSEYADQILTESAVTGLSTDSLQKYHYAAGLVDVDVGTITKSLAKNTKQMASAQKGTGAAADAYAKLGVKVTKSNGELRNSEKVFWEAIDALGEIENETERDALAMELFGKSAQELNPLIEAGSDRMKELGEQAEAAGAVMSDDMLNAYREFNDKLEELQSGVDIAKRALGTALLPVLDQLAGAGVDMLSDFSQALLDCNGDIEQMASVAGEYLGKAVQMITDYIPEMVTMGGELVGGLLSGIAQNLPEIVSSVTAALDDLRDRHFAARTGCERMDLHRGPVAKLARAANVDRREVAVVRALQDQPRMRVRDGHDLVRGDDGSFHYQHAVVGRLGARGERQIVRDIPRSGPIAHLVVHVEGAARAPVERVRHGRHGRRAVVKHEVAGFHADEVFRRAVERGIVEEDEVAAFDDEVAGRRLPAPVPLFGADLRQGVPVHRLTPCGRAATVQTVCANSRVGRE